MNCELLWTSMDVVWVNEIDDQDWIYTWTLTRLSYLSSSHWSGLVRTLFCWEHINRFFCTYSYIFLLNQKDDHFYGLLNFPVKLVDFICLSFSSFHNHDISLFLVSQLWQKFKGGEKPPAFLGSSKEYNVDMVPKVFWAGLRHILLAFTELTVTIMGLINAFYESMFVSVKWVNLLHVTWNSCFNFLPYEVLLT